MTGGNNVTPNQGYKFTGDYSYIITDKNGNIIETGVTNEPTNLKIIGNIEFTPVYEKLPWAQWIDPDTDRTIKPKTPFIDKDIEPIAPSNPVREGYDFVDWSREVDEEGNVTYKAHWEKRNEPQTQYNSDEQMHLDTKTQQHLKPSNIEQKTESNSKISQTGDNSIYPITLVAVIFAGIIAKLMISKKQNM